jgi:hypothetical protein
LDLHQKHADLVLASHFLQFFFIFVVTNIGNSIVAYL